MSQLAEAASEEGAESELLATHRCLVALGLVPCSRGHGREGFRGAPHPAGDLGEVSERLLVESSKCFFSVRAPGWRTLRTTSSRKGTRHLAWSMCTSTRGICRVPTWSSWGSSLGRELCLNSCDEDPEVFNVSYVECLGRSSGLRPSEVLRQQRAAASAACAGSGVDGAAADWAA